MKDLESLNATFVIDTFLLLLIGIGPKIALAPFLDVTTDMTGATKRRVLRKMLTTAAKVAALLLVLGGLLTRLLHFSPGALGVASGIILLIIAVAMVLRQQNGNGGGHPVKDLTRCRPPSSRWPCPTCPTQPGSSSWSPCRQRLAQSQCSQSPLHARRGARARRRGVPLAVQVGSKLDASRMLVTEKVFGFLLAALAVQLALNGLSAIGAIHLITSH
ncbi:MAG: MarC family protein [Streptosporangiaceae bacterium]